MNNPVNFELAKLLKEKDWSNPTLNFYFEDGESKENVLKEITGMDYGSEFIIEFSELIENWNNGWLTKKNGNRCFGCSKTKGYFETFSAPTISEVVMWLYEKYGIWISVEEYKDHASDVNDEPTFISNIEREEYSSPTEAYQGAIEYTLNNLL